MSKISGITNGEITSGQLAKILYLFTLGSAALIVPTAMVSLAKQDSWISMLLVIPIHYSFIYLYLLLYNRFPRLSLVQYTEKIIGVWPGKAIALTFVFFYLVLSSLVLRNMADFLGKSVLPRTPEWFISGTFMIVIAYGVYLGIETIARTGEILFFWTLLVVIIISLTLLNQMQGENFAPVLGNGWSMPFKGLYPVLGFPLAECVFLSSILPMVKEQDRTKLNRRLGAAVVLSGGISTVIISLLIAVLGVSETMRSPFPVYEMAKSINIEEILVRVEILFAMVWIGTLFMKLALTVYSLVVSLSQLLGLSTYRPMVFPLCAMIVPLSMIIYRNNVHATVFSMDVWTVYSVTQGVLIPLALLMIAVAFGRRSELDGRFPERKPVRSGKGAE